MSYSLDSAMLTGQSHNVELLHTLQKSSSLKLSFVGFLKLIPGKAFQLILHFLAHISAQPLLEFMFQSA